MDKKSTDINGTGSSFIDEATVNLISKSEKTDEPETLLPQSGGLSKNVSKKNLRVQWNDDHGNLLTEVLEFQPSDVSDSEEEEEESDSDSDLCYCTIMVGEQMVSLLKAIADRMRRRSS